MSSVIIQGNASGSGAITIESPNTNSNYTLSLPENTGTIVTTGGASSLTTSGNLTFTGTGNRITGDFSNVTVANRVVFQSSTTDGATAVFAIPNGTNTNCNFTAVNNSNPANASLFQLASLATEGRLSAGISGTGSYLPMTFYTGGSERMRIDTSGNVTLPGSTASAIYPRFSVGVGTGAAALTVNDGYGNCNVAFNHTAGIPDTSGSSARIVSDVDSATAGFRVQMGSSTTAGVAVGLTTAMQIDSAYNFQFNSGYGSVATAYGCRAWVNFNGTGTPAIRSSGNVSSLTDNGTADYTINFTTALPDANYSVVGSSRVVIGVRTTIVGFTSLATTSVRCITVALTNAVSEEDTVCVGIFR